MSACRAEVVMTVSGGLIHIECPECGDRSVVKREAEK